jgi:putative transcriptional regulator
VSGPTLKGKLLVARPTLLDPNFSRTVILLLEHGDDGALGLVLDRPSDTPVGAALPGWSRLTAAPGVVFVGGPVAPGAALALALQSPGVGMHGDSFQPVVGALGALDLSLDPDALGSGTEVRLFAGYSGWGGGQLEGELAEGSWIVADADEHDALTARPDELWRDVLRRQGGTTAWLAHAPGHPSEN